MRRATPQDACEPDFRRPLALRRSVGQRAKKRNAMPPLERSNNIAARMGRWSASHWKTAVFGWLAFVIAAVAIGYTVGEKKIDQKDANVGQSHRADHLLRDAGFRPDPQTEIVLV